MPQGMQRVRGYSYMERELIVYGVDFSLPAT